MTGDCHVQFCEGLWVKLPRSTLLESSSVRTLIEQIQLVGEIVVILLSADSRKQRV